MAEQVCDLKYYNTLFIANWHFYTASIETQQFYIFADIAIQNLLYSIIRIKKKIHFQNTFSMLTSPRSKGTKNTLALQNHSQISNKSFKQIIRKSTQEQYEDLFKTLSANYFDNTAVGAIIHKQVKDNSIRPRSLRQVSNENTNHTKNLQSIQEFNSSKQISKLLKIGDVFECNQLKRQATKQNGQDSKNNDETRNKQILGQKQTPSTNKSNNITRPATSGPCRKFSRYLSAKNKRNSRDDFKFVRIQGKNETNNLKRLKKSVDELENIAITKYGVEFKCYDHTLGSKYQQNTNIRIQQMKKKLKEIRNSREEQEQVVQDCTIPKGFMKFLCGGKKNAPGLCSMAKRSSSSIYLRVF